MNFGLRLFAKLLLFLTAIATIGALQEHRWALGWLGGVLVASAITFVAVLVHELAHAVAAHGLGAAVTKIVVLPIELSLAPIRLRFVGRAGHGDLGGYVSYRLDEIAAERKHALIAVAGPLANILTGVAAGLVAQQSGQAVRTLAATGGIYEGHGEPIISAVATSLMLVSVGLGFANLLPFDQSDGKRLWHYFRWRGRHT